MDDSERSYGYSRDIYHAHRRPGGIYRRNEGGYATGTFYPDGPAYERSYEYGREQGLGDDPPDEELAPEERAVRIRRQRAPSATSRGAAGRHYDYGFAGPYGEVDSYTWDVPGPYRGRGPRGYRRAAERIHEDICDRLEAHGNLDASEIEVSVERGEVTLNGTVPDRQTKRLAEVVAEHVRGVVDVHNRLTLATAGGKKPED
jgi:BON domain